MEAIVKNGLLYDFYGGLLTDKQRRIMSLYYNEDWNMSEIADSEQVSRQAVHDLIRRSDHVLEGYEEKLGLLKRFMEQRELLQSIKQDLHELSGDMLHNDKLLAVVAKVERLIEIEE